ncbi:hypothetical protein [uncultured Rikenella sp.]|uniref:hypothetical protein n=1 Tax=uncultured Rikenella sp. TaxID=368003 RepID=UPI0025D05E1B|nr:hypothetical protein [uncultured Rikenella sp.]
MTFSERPSPTRGKRVTVSRRTGFAPGYRERNTGISGGDGNCGYSWSATVSDIFGIDLDFGMTWLNSNALFRAHGIQLRCLSE